MEIAHSTNNYFAHFLPLRHVVILLFLGILTACQSHHTDDSMHDLENRAWSNPDSVFDVLESMDCTRLDETNRYYYQFLYQLTSFRSYRPLSPDSLTAAEEYFRSHNFNDLAGKIAYVRGAEYDYLGLHEQALISLKDAEYLLERSHRADNYIGMTYLKLANRYEHDFLYDIAHDYYEKSIRIFEQIDTTSFYMSFARLNYGRTFDKDSVELILTQLNKALQLAQDYHYTTIEPTIRLYIAEITDDTTTYVQLATMYCAQGSYRYADILVNHYMQISTDSTEKYLELYKQDYRNSYNNIEYPYLLAQYWYSIQQYDSAFHTLRSLWEAERLSLIENAHQRTYALSRFYEVEQERKNTIQQRAQKQYVIIYATGATIVLLIIILILTMFMLKHRHEKEMLQQDTLRQRKLLQQILEERLAVFKQIQKLKMTGKSDNASMANVLWDQMSFNNPTKWDEFHRQFKIAYPKVVNALQKRCPQLSENETNLIELIVLGTSTDDICILLNLSKRTVWNRRQFIKNHLGDSKLDLDSYLQGLV